MLYTLPVRVWTRVRYARVWLQDGRTVLSSEWEISEDNDDYDYMEEGECGRLFRPSGHLAAGPCKHRFRFSCEGPPAARPLHQFSTSWSLPLRPLTPTFMDKTLLIMPAAARRVTTPHINYNKINKYI